MPLICPHCHKMVAERPTCAVCGKPLPVKAMPRPGMPAPDAGPDIDRATIFYLMRYTLGWVLGIVAVGVVCLIGVVVLLT